MMDWWRPPASGLACSVASVWRVPNSTANTAIASVDQRNVADDRNFGEPVFAQDGSSDDATALSCSAM